MQVVLQESWEPIFHLRKSLVQWIMQHTLSNVFRPTQLRSNSDRNTISGGIMFLLGTTFLLFSLINVSIGNQFALDSVEICRYMLSTCIRTKSHWKLTFPQYASTLKPFLPFQIQLKCIWTLWQRALELYSVKCSNPS